MGIVRCVGVQLVARFLTLGQQLTMSKLFGNAIVREISLPMQCLIDFFIICYMGWTFLIRILCVFLAHGLKAVIGPLVGKFQWKRFAKQNTHHLSWQRIRYFGHVRFSVAKRVVFSSSRKMYGILSKEMSCYFRALHLVYLLLFNPRISIEQNQRQNKHKPISSFS